MKKIIITLALPLIALTSCTDKTPSNAASAPAVPVTVSTIGDTDSGSYISASGKLEAEQSANISTRMMGYITKVHVAAGQKVAAGQLLVSISNADLQAKKAQADAAVAQAEAAYRNARKDFERFTALFKQQSASQKELDDMTSRYDMAKASLDAAKQMRNEASAQFAYTNITAPFRGEVANTFVKEGDMANPGMPLVALEGSGRIQLTAMVAETDIANLKTGMKAEVAVASANAKTKGTIVEVSGSARHTGGQYLVKVDIDKPSPELRPGMYAHVKFPVRKTIGTSTLIVVPEEALVRQGQLTGIYTVGTGNIAVLRWVRIGKPSAGGVEILSGLTKGESYIASAKGKLYNGAPISVQ